MVGAGEQPPPVHRGSIGRDHDCDHGDDASAAWVAGAMPQLLLYERDRRSGLASMERRTPLCQARSVDRILALDRRVVVPPRKEGEHLRIFQVDGVAAECAPHRDAPSGLRTIAPARRLMRALVEHAPSDRARLGPIIERLRAERPPGTQSVVPQTAARPTQVSPVAGFFADATMWSMPERFGMRRATVKDPLGAVVVREPAKTRTPLSVMTTFQF